ncbi:MAG: ATP-binding cassette domain-containing protein [Tissierellia bacterium]|nr:ATP-binding cassette domain-containing protein [Tissierellia bacterium]
MNKTILTVKDLKVSIGKDSILKNIYLQVQKGCIYGILGPSGVGKSTLLFGLAGLLKTPPYTVEGHISFEDGKNILGYTEREKQIAVAKYGSIIFQQAMSALDPYQNVYNALQEIIHLKESKDKDYVKRRIYELLQLVGLDEEKSLLEKYPHELSGGMAQRITLALALIGPPQILLADEPTSSMDAIYALSFVKHLKELVEDTKISVLFVSHDLALLANFCDRILVMDQGVLVENESTEKILTSPKSEMGKRLLEESKRISRYEID